jgi:hypothetical protein
MSFRGLFTDFANGGQYVRKGAAVVLTDANVKALPTTPITLLAAQGANTWARLVGLTLDADFAAGAYTNVDTDGFMWAYYDGASDEIASEYVPNSVSLSLNKLTALTSAGSWVAHLRPYGEAYETDTWGTVGTIHTRANVVNVAIKLTVDNDGSGAFTGGNAANTLTVTPYFVIESV